MAVDPVLAGAALLCLLVHLLLRRLFYRQSSTLPLPPGPRGIPVLGALPLIGPMPHAGLARLARQYGPIMYLKMGTSGVVVASTPAAARSFLKTLDLQFANRPPIISAKEITYDGQNLVFSNYGPRLKLLRKLSSLHMLGPRALATWNPIRRDEVGHMLRSIQAGAAAPVVVPDVLMCAMANIIGRVTVSRRVFEEQGKESGEFREMIVELLTGGGMFNIGDFVPAVAWMDLQGIQRKLRGVHQRFDKMVTRLVAEHAASAHEREGRPDFLDLVTANRTDADGETLSDVNIKGLIFDLFTAGTDTSSIVIEWALAELLLNPTILHRLQSETDRVVGRDRRLKESDLPHLPYLQAVCKEALRKHPSTPLSLPHYSFSPCDVGGFHVPANTRLLVNIWAIGRDPDVWDAPLEFRPERFLDGREGDEFELIPFGAGRRVCAGKQAGMLMVQYILGSLVHAFEWRMPDRAELNMDEAAGLALPKAVPLAAMVAARLAAEAYA